MQYRIDLTNDEVPTKWYNINADLPVELPAPKNSRTLPKIRKTYSFMQSKRIGRKAKHSCKDLL